MTSGIKQQVSCELLPTAYCLLPTILWRRRVGIEPTRACSHSRAYGFEDRAAHQNGCASTFVRGRNQTLSGGRSNCQERAHDAPGCTRLTRVRETAIIAFE